MGFELSPAVLVEGVSADLRGGEAVAEVNHSLLLIQDICAARSLLTIRGGRSAILVLNFSSWHQRFSPLTAITSADAI